MRTVLIGALAATLVGCSCLLPPQTSMESCTNTNGFACFDRMAASQPTEPKRASFQNDSATTENKSTIAAKAEPSASRVPLPPRSSKTPLQPASNAAADSNKTRANIAASHPTGGVVANSNTRTIKGQVAAAAATAEPMTAGTVVPAPVPEVNNKDRSNRSETVPRGDAEKPAPVSPNEPHTGSAQDEPSDTPWVISETTSPVDYSPLITAVVQSTSSVKDAPNTLAVRCSRSRTELLLRTEGVWHASRASEVLVDYQINDQPSVRLRWTVSADGKTASYKDDAVGLLRSLPEGARLKIVFDGPGLGQEATFQLTGLDSVRKKIGLACKWPSTPEKSHRGKQ